MNVDVFFSCSFATDDKAVNEYFSAICRALDIRAANISTGFAATPPEAAKTMIGDSLALVAICTRRDELANGEFRMSDAVHEELSFAFGKDIPVLMFVERGVQMGGFQDKFATHLRFDRDQLNEPEMLEKCIRAIHNLKMEIVSHDDAILGQDTSDYFAEFVRHLFEMKDDGGDYFWAYSCTKRLNFLKSFKRSMPTGVWTTRSCRVPENAPKVHWEAKVDRAPRPMELKTTIEKHTPECLEALIRFEPHPSEGDIIEYSTYAESRYLNPIWDEDLLPCSPLHLGSGDYKCYDGLVPIQRTKKASLVFRFPRSYGLAADEVVPFVGSYTSNVDYEVESELRRAVVEIQTFGGSLEVRMEIDSPLLRHLYGVAWNPKKCSARSQS